MRNIIKILSFLLLISNGTVQCSDPMLAAITSGNRALVQSLYNSNAAMYSRLIYKNKITEKWPDFFNAPVPAAATKGGTGTGTGGSGPALTGTQGVVDISQTMQDALATGNATQVAGVFNALSNQGLTGSALTTLQNFKPRITSSLGGTFSIGVKGYDQYNPPTGSSVGPVGPPPPPPPGAPVLNIPTIAPLAPMGAGAPPPPPPPGFGPTPPPPPPGVPAAPVIPPYVPHVLKAEKKLANNVKALNDKLNQNVTDPKPYQDVLLGISQTLRDQIPQALELVKQVVIWSDAAVPNLAPNTALGGDIDTLAAAFSAVPVGKPTPITGTTPPTFLPVLTVTVDSTDSTRCIYSFTPLQEQLKQWVNAWANTASPVVQNADNPSPQVVARTFNRMLNDFFGLCAVAIQLYVVMAKLQNSSAFTPQSELTQLTKLQQDQKDIETSIEMVKTALGRMIMDGLNAKTPVTTLKADLKAFDLAECGPSAVVNTNLTTFESNVKAFASSRALFVKEYETLLAALGGSFSAGMTSKLVSVMADFQDFKLNYTDACYIPPQLAPGTAAPACSLVKPKRTDASVWLADEQNITLVLGQDPASGNFNPTNVEIYDKTLSPFTVYIPATGSKPLFGPVQPIGGISPQIGFLKGNYNQTVVAATIDLGEWELFRPGAVAQDRPFDNGHGGYDIYVWAPEFSKALTVDAAFNAESNLHRIYFAQTPLTKGGRFQKDEYVLRLNDGCFFDKTKKKARLYKFFSYDAATYKKRVAGKSPITTGANAGKFIKKPIEVDSSFQKIDSPKNYMEFMYNALMDKLEKKGVTPPPLVPLNPGDQLVNP